MRRYLRILTGPGAAVPFVLALLARLPVSMTPLGLVLLVQSVRGNYSEAGAVTAAFTLGVAVGTPFWGSRLDSSGQTRVLLPLGLISGALLVVLTLSAEGDADLPLLIALAAGVGLTFPPISPAMRAAWRELLTDPGELRAAYALEGVVIEVMFVAGPLLISALLVTGPPQVPLLITAALLALGSAGYALTRVARRWRPVPLGAGERRRGVSPLRVPGVLAALVVAAAVATSFGLLDVSLAATATDVLGNQTKVGLLFGAIAGGSAIGGTLYGARHPSGPEYRWVPYALGGFMVGALVVTLALRAEASSMWILTPLLFLTGLSIAPALIMLANLVDTYGPRDRLGEAQGWLSTAFTAGGAAGTAVGGPIIDSRGPTGSFASVSVLLAVGVLLALGARRVWRGSVPGLTP